MANTLAVVVAVILGLIELVMPFFLIDDDSYQTATVYAWLISFPTLRILSKVQELVYLFNLIYFN